MSTDAKPSNVRELYVQAVRIEEDAERQAFLEEACGGQIELRQRVEQLLDARAPGRENLLQRATSDSISGQNSFSWNGADIGKTIDSHPEAMADDRTRDDSVRGQIDISTHPMIGNYRLLEELGHGGMGTVYMAAQSKPVKRQVALKVIKPGMDSKEVIARFEAERQALAMMDHPHIARVLDGGTTDEGRPYFVMELVRGVPITEFCKQKSLPLRERLELFVDICHAVQHAHQKGIIHRDLKPSNIMVTLHDGKPVVKVIDFGVAKALHQELTERTLFTHFSQMVGTPLYMAPEQAEMSGLGVDTRSDIYSLGVVLYELLTGTTPFDRDTMSKLGIDGIRKMIQEQEPPRPSARISTLKAADRSTIEDQRQLDTEDIGKQLNREVDWIVMKALEKDRERRYETANAFAADIQRFLNDEPVEAHPPSTFYRLKKYANKHKKLLTTAAMLVAMLVASTAVSALFALQANEAKKRAENQREEAVEARQLADSRLKQSQVDFDRALNSLDTIVSHLTSPDLAELPGVDRFRKDVLEQAMSFYGDIIEDHNDDPHARFQRAVAHRKIAKLYGRLPDYRKQLEEHNATLSILDELMDQDPLNLDYQRAYLETLNGRAWMPKESLSNRKADAELGLKIIRKSPDRENPWKNEQLVTFIGMKLAFGPDSSEEAEKLAREALEIPGDYRGGRTVLNWLARRAEEDEDPATAFDYYRQSLKLNQRLLHNEPNDPGLLRSYVAIQLQCAKMCEVQAKYRMAEEYYRESFVRAVALRDRYKHYYRTQEKLEEAASKLSRFLTERDRPKEASQILRESLQHLTDGTALHKLHSKQLFRLDDSIEHLTNAIKEFPDVGAYYRDRQVAYRDRGEYERALSDADRSVELAREDPDVYLARAHTYLVKQQFDKHALADIKKSLELSTDKASVLWQIPVDEVANCSDQSFKDGLAAIADRAIENNDTVSLRVARANLLGAMQFDERAESDFKIALKSASDEDDVHAYYLKFLAKRERWHDALIVIEELNTLAPSEYYPCYQAALLNLYLGGVGKYRVYCERMLSAPYSDVSKGNELEIHFTAWTCTLAPDALDNYDPAISLAREAVDKQPSNQQYLNGLGAILMRAGRYEESQEQLEEALEAGETDSTSSSYIHYFLAMTRQALGDTKEAQTQLRKANEIAESELSDSASWNHRLTLQLLRKEAESQITPSQNDADAKSKE